MTPQVPQKEVVPEFEAFLDLTDDVLPWLQLSTEPEPQRDMKLELVMNGICRRTQNYLGRPIAPITYFKRFSAWPGSTILLPYYPITEVIRVVEYRGQSGPFELKEQTPEHQYTEAFQVEPLTGSIIRVFQGLIQRPWFPGSKNIEITWKAGFNPIPDDIKLAALEYIKKWWDSTQQGSRSVQPAASLGYTGEVSPGMAGVWGDLQRTLDLYVQQGIG